MQMIADQLGVTKVSVSKALNSQPGVSQNLRRQILDRAHVLGYRNKGSRTMERSDVINRNFIFLVSKRFFVETDRFYTGIYFYLSRLLTESGHSLILRVTDVEEERDLVRPYLESDKTPDGIFIAGEMNERYLMSLQHLGIPSVAIDFFKPHLALDCVIMDNFYASYMATHFLIDRGHVSIGFIGNPQYSTSVADRYYGYLKALAEHSLHFREEWHLITNDEMGVYSTEITLPDSLPTAFVCHCDMAAYHLMLILQRYNVEVPKQVSLLSFDNTILSQSTTPPLTTVDIDTAALAKRAFEQMRWRLENLDAPASRTILSASIVERESVATLQDRLPELTENR